MFCFTKIHYICGTGTGSVHLYEWAQPTPVTSDLTNTFVLTDQGCSGQQVAGARGARVTALRFDETGRKFGCGDADGHFGLWNLNTTNSGKPPYFVSVYDASFETEFRLSWEHNY
ncbi:unnamed protein product [Protopolystoma xenopodis]|uniref:Uncharacterized protein n=1 Tax=Protopolystoma xenopodis TaxID=117903 RepID=A0A448XQG5_9PLAT|nr:unnamed protein product [Protopolystoma xenopodis]